MLYQGLITIIASTVFAYKMMPGAANPNLISWRVEYDFKAHEALDQFLDCQAAIKYFSSGRIQLADSGHEQICAERLILVETSICTCT